MDGVRTDIDRMLDVDVVDEGDVLDLDAVIAESQSGVSKSIVSIRIDREAVGRARDSRSDWVERGAGLCGC